jgi:hypothetical protein
LTVTTVNDNSTIDSKNIAFDDFNHDISNSFIASTL